MIKDIADSNRVAGSLYFTFVNPSESVMFSLDTPKK